MKNAMKASSVFSRLVSILLLCALAATAQKPTAKHNTTTSPRQSADQASRTQLAAYLVDFQSHPDDAALRGKMIELAKSLNPAPEIPQRAHDDYTKAIAQMTSASSTDAFETVAQLFEHVAEQAPWFAEAYYNAAFAHAKANTIDSARRNLALYLAAVRPGVDIQNAEQLRRDLDRNQAEQFQQALQQFTAAPTDSARLHVIQLARAMGTPPEIPESAHGHFVMAVVYVNTATENSDYERAITEYKAALLAAPWWGEAYKKLASAQELAGRYDDAIANLIFYQTINPAGSRSAMDDIYRLKALGQKTADEQAKQQAEDQKHALLQEQQQKVHTSNDAINYSIEGRWYLVSEANENFFGGESNPECDYLIKQNSGRWEIKNSCSASKRNIHHVEAQSRQLSFKITGRDPGFQFAEVVVTLALSSDGQSLEGTAVAYDKKYLPYSNYHLHWVRRK
jgi:tetratricopeptide (TPR) repeat protein